MITLNNFLHRFEQFATNHYFIQSYSEMEITAKDLEKETRWPRMHVVPLPVQAVAGQTVYQFDVFMLDLPSNKSDKYPRQREVMSDCVQYIQDLLAEIANGGNIFKFSEQYGIEKNFTIEVFEEDFSNVLTGARCTVSVFVPWAWDACGLPISNLPDPAPADCPEATVSNSDGSYSVTVVSGGTLVLPDVTITSPIIEGQEAYRYSATSPSVQNVSVPNVDVQVQSVSVADVAPNRDLDIQFTVQNSDDSYDVDITSPTEVRGVDGSLTLKKILELPDVTVTDNVGTELGTFPAAVNITLSQTIPTQNGIAYKRPNYSQRNSYTVAGAVNNGATSYDEGWHLRNGSYDYTPPVYPVSYAALDLDDSNPFKTLANNNSFGNTARFTDATGSELTVATQYVVDNLTGLGWWAAEVNGSANWVNQLAYIATATQGGYSDWRMPSNDELKSIMYENGSGWYAPFQNMTANALWTCTTNIDNTVQAVSTFATKYFSRTTKTSSLRTVMVRNHF